MPVFKTIAPIYAAQESITDIAMVWGENTTWAEDVRAAWDIPEDFLDCGGGVVVLPFARVLLAGKEHLAQVLAKRMKKMKSRDAILDQLWEALLTAKSVESSYFM